MTATPRKVESKPARSRSLVTTSPAVQATPEAFTLPFSVGDVIADKYEVVGILGSGGVAYVISALHLELGEMVALKFLRPESLAHEEVVARFASEARSVARIKSEHVAHVFDVGTLPDGAPFIVMEYLEGKDLADVLAERHKLPIKQAVDYVLQACEAIACAHAAGIVHRDIKPENLFLTQQAASVEVVKVLDFGISKNALGVLEPVGRRAHTMLPMGTPGYMSPEQIRACGTVDARTDIWALGCVLSELITGLSAFDAPTLLQLSATILERDPIPLRKVMPEAPPELEAVILKCLEKDADKRFQDVAELAAALYPFGPRRARISVERCHHVLKGKTGVVIEFNSVPPPSLNSGAPLPLSSPSALMTQISQPAPSTNTPATISLVDADLAAPKRKSRSMIVAGVIGVAAIGGIALALGTGGPGKRAAAVAPEAAPTLVAAPVVAPLSAPVTVTPSAPAASVPALVLDVDSLEDAAPSASGNARARAKAVRVQRAAAAAVAVRQEAAAASAAAKPKPRRNGLDDSEPDVGY